MVVSGLSLPPTTGPYCVGSKAWELNKITQNDPVASDGIGKSVILNVYYPTRNETLPRPYILGGLATYYEEYYNVSSGAFGNATARILDAAPTTGCDDLALPTLLWGPPFTGPPSQMFSSLFTDLVSKGYIIVTVDHPGEQPYLKYPNGTGITGLGKDFIPTSEFISRIHEYRLEDNSAVLNALPVLRKELGIPLNTTHVALFGHSLGGSAALNQLLFDRNRIHPQILGSIDIDGQVFPPAFANDSSANVHTPTLLLMSDEHLATGDFSLAQFVSWQSRWAKHLIVHGKTNHTDFSDLAVLLQGDGDTGGNGAIKAHRMVEITRRFVRAFFGMVGRMTGEGVLSGSEQVNEVWPEVEFSSSAPSSVAWV
ncbi:uncharacterized protein N0V89_007357 [Didymosphaeria variabile]|uniref:1-alkyl-2-acetylglycerophosphocholine esterase n=1 Tax=Didymosphaeria variabile TaxID=1932322 RepID=A0A9W8XKQ6_9PLEO|nr:uncharacterized protein N0V89_007357 [Didymosphaeria variabile]KAJ4352011.1 hypothetical protein N0V89_007357 [Didymosphaeria variabile]